MRKQWPLLAAPLIGMLLLALLARYRIPNPKININASSFNKIEVGMALAEAENIIGVPPGNYASGSVTIFDGPPGTWCQLLGEEDFSGEDERLWLGDEGAILVRVDPGGSIISTHF